MPLAPLAGSTWIVPGVGPGRDRLAPSDTVPKSRRETSSTLVLTLNLPIATSVIRLKSKVKVRQQTTPSRWQYGAESRPVFLLFTLVQFSR